jgi:Uncharacterized protein conserved in cyanobacteria
MSMPTFERRWTAADLARMPEDGNRYEVIDGELFVTPAPSYRHQEAALVLHGILRNYLRRERVGHALVAPADVEFSPKRLVQPDVFVVPLVDGRRPEHFHDVNRLLLAAEVLSPGTARADRVAKRTLFRDQGVPEYWIVDLDSRVIERSTPADPRVEIAVDRLVWLPEGAGGALEIDVEKYFAEVLDG